jgi:peptide/nickel transport system permease protein
MTRPKRSPGPWRRAWRRFRRRKLSVAALAFVALLTAAAVFSPAIAGTKPLVCRYKGSLYFPALGYFNPRWENAIFLRDRFHHVYPANLTRHDPESWALWPLVYQDPERMVRSGEWPGQPENPGGIDDCSPNRWNWFGTTQAGIDVFAQMVHGTRVALLVGFASMGLAAAIGIGIGALAGYFRGWVDGLLGRVIELVMCIPSLVLILALLAIVEHATLWHIMVVLGLTQWTGIARLTRGEFLKLRSADYVVAARALGAGPPRIIFRHILPNAMAPLLAPITFGIAAAVLIESGLSFLGFGDPTAPSWGNLLSEARQQQYTFWWLLVFPGLAVFLTVLAYNLVGEGVQDATDPRA